MNDSSKVLKVIFVILLIITIGELFYFFYYQPFILNTKTDNTPLNNTISDDGLAIHKSQIEYLSTLKKISVDQLKIFNSIGGVGIISNIKKLTDEQISFDLIDENGKKSTNIKFPININAPTHVYLSENEVIIKANLENISEGDKIKFLWIYDLTKQSGQDIYNNELIIYKNNNEKIY